LPELALPLSLSSGEIARVMASRFPPAPAGIVMFRRYLLAGGALFLLDLAVFLALTRLGSFSIPVGQWISRATGATAGFVVHRYFSFADSRAGPRRLVGQGWFYALLTIAGIAISPLVLGSAAALTGYRMVPAKVISEVVMITINFFVLRQIFRPWRVGTAPK